MPAFTAPTFAAACLAVACAGAWPSGCRAQTSVAHAPDPRLREVWYDPQAVISVPVKRGVVTHVLLDPAESIAEVGTGLGSDCAKPEASWCVAAQQGGRNIFVKPKTSASTPNNLAVVTDRRSYSLRFVLVPEGDTRQPVYRLSIRVTAPTRIATDGSLAPETAALFPPIQLPPPAQLTAERLAAEPVPRNASYSLAQGAASEDIVPTLVFDDGRFTYFRFPNNREVPAVFHVLGDGSETVVNARMEGDLLVADRVSRRLMLRAGNAVVGVFNDAFDLDGVPPANGTTVAGVKRTLRADPADPNGASTEEKPR